MSPRCIDTAFTIVAVSLTTFTGALRALPPFTQPLVPAPVISRGELRGADPLILPVTMCDTPWGMTIEPMLDAEGGHWGVRISALRDGRAKTVGLLEDDIIIKANDHHVRSTETEGAPQRLVTWFRALHCDAPVAFTIVRGTTRMELSAPGLKA